MPRGLLPIAGKRRAAYAVGQSATHAAIGRGDWSDVMNPPVEVAGQTALRDEIGRVPISRIDYLIPDAAGTIQFDGDETKYRLATQAEIDDAEADESGPTAPSNDLLVKYTIPMNVANGEVVCEVAVFTNSTVAVPGFAPAAQVTNIGHMLYLAHIKGYPIESDSEMTRYARITIL